MLKMDVYSIEKITIKEIANLLDSYRAAIDDICCGQFKTSLLQAACYFNRYEIVELLIVRGANIDWKGSYEDRLFVSWSQEYSALKGAGHHPESIESMTVAKWTPLMIATHEGYFEIVELLVRNGANRKLCNRFGDTASDLTENSKIISLLLE